MPSSTLTIRIDEDLKRQIEQAAAAEERTVTDFVTRAAKLRMIAQCATCGRSEASGPLPAGLTPDMDGFLELVRREDNRFIPILITTIEAGRPYAYNGILEAQRQKDEEHRGTVVLMIGRSHMEPAVVSYPIPRGLITGWDFDQDARRQASLVRYGGYLNGNVAVLMRAAGH